MMVQPIGTTEGRSIDVREDDGKGESQRKWIGINVHCHSSGQVAWGTQYRVQIMVMTVQVL